MELRRTLLNLFMNLWYMHLKKPFLPKNTDWHQLKELYKLIAKWLLLTPGKYIFILLCWFFLLEASIFVVFAIGPVLAADTFVCLNFPFWKVIHGWNLCQSCVNFPFSLPETPQKPWNPSLMHMESKIYQFPWNRRLLLGISCISNFFVTNFMVDSE